MSLFLRVFILFLLFGSSVLFGSIGKVSLLKGEASLDRAGTMLEVKSGMDLEEKDSIKTTKGSQIQLIFADKTVITLGSESHFRVDEYLSEGSSPKAKFKFSQGTFKTITGRIGKSAPENFTLETKTATIGIRGTVIGGIISTSSSVADTIFCLGGQITVGSLQVGDIVNLPSGTMTTVATNGSPASPRELTPQDITQFSESLGTPPSPGSPTEGSSTPQSSSNEFQSMNFGETLTPPALPSTFQGIQTFEPAAATTAQQTNLQNTTQSNVAQSVELLKSEQPFDPDNPYGPNNPYGP